MPDAPELIRPLAVRDAPAVARIDRTSREGDVLPGLGARFLQVLYGEMLGNPLALGFGAFGPSGEMIGFVLGTSDMRSLFRSVSPSHNLRMLAATLRALLLHPTSAPRVIESSLYPSREGEAEVPAELIVIGVDESNRSRGWGSKLVCRLREGFRNRGVSRFKVTVKEKRERAVAFYIREGFTESMRFRMFGETWITLTRQVK